MIRIFVEGRDTNFLKVYIKHLQDNETLPNTINVQIDDIGGYTKLHLSANLFKENTDTSGTNLLIFDADSAENNGGYQVRSDYLTAKKAELGIDFEQFLFPNNADEGDFETLLENIINEAHRGMWNCFMGYETCVNGFTNEDGTHKYKTPIRKSRVFAYIDAFPKSRSADKKFRRNKDFFFENSDYWNLDAAYLEPLKAFLILHIR